MRLYTTFLKKGRVAFSLQVLFWALLLVYANQAHAGLIADFWKFLAGAEVEAEENSSAAAVSMPLLGSQTSAPARNGAGGPVESVSPSLLAVQDSALIASRNPAGTLPWENYDQIVAYTVQPGDTPSAIAVDFGISLNTLLWANNIRNADTIKAGDELIILPISGVRYEIKKGDTIDSIAKKFKGDAPEILSFNGLAIGESLKVGEAIIIPDGEQSAPLPAFSNTTPAALSYSRFASLPEKIGYYIRPVLGGRNPRATAANPHGLHGYNGVDLANSCGVPVMAAAQGTVLIARSTGWSSGYGKYVVVAHPNGTQTLYAHLANIFVSTGRRVEQGAHIGLIGSTGNSTGCHVHFEIRGAKNPF